MRKKIFYMIFVLSLALSPFMAMADSGYLSGRILLQVESHGEAWYVSPQTSKRYYLGRPDDALRIMREQGIGISNQDLAKIPDDNETNLVDPAFAKKHKGKIFLAVEDKGRAWYVNPLDLKRYYLGRPADAFALLQLFGLGISNENLDKIPADSEKPNFLSLEKRIHELVNQERIINNFKELKNSEALAAVAREHSENLALENKAFTAIEKVCDLPLIHHEGLDFGITHSDRLHNRGIYDYSSSGENIALITRLDYSIEYIPGDSIKKELDDCELARQKAETDFKNKIDSAKDSAQKLAIINNEIIYRIGFFNNESVIEPINIINHSEEQIAQKTVKSWMESPGHRKNILNAEYDASGIGVALIDAYIIATQVFVKEAVCGYENGPCCESGGCYLPQACGADGVCR